MTPYKAWTPPSSFKSSKTSNININLLLQLQLCFAFGFPRLNIQSPFFFFDSSQPEKLLMEFSETDDWAWLPEGILEGILNSIVSFYDFARFCAVCKHWNFVAQQRRRQLTELWSVQLPLLMFPFANGCEDHQTLYNVTTNKTYDFKLPHYNKRCCGYSHGWLAATDKNMLITLRNPFLNQIITLPPIIPVTIPEYHIYGRHYDDYWIYKVVLSHNPYMHPDKYEVVAICEECLAILKPGSQSWVYIYRLCTIINTCRNDIIFYEGMLLMMDSCKLVSINVNGSQPQVETMKDGQFSRRWNCNCKCVEYLVKSSEGDLVYIRRFIRYVDGKTMNFKIYKIRRDSILTNKDGVNEVRSLGDDALFLGDSHSLCVKASNFPGCKPDAIYFAPHNWIYTGNRGFHDMGVFNLKDRRITPHYHCDRSRRYIPPPVWIVPTLGDNAHAMHE